jgi:hypothetical protein
MAGTPKKSSTPKKSPKKSPVKGKSPKSAKASKGKSPAKTPKKAETPTKVVKAIVKDGSKKKKGMKEKDPNKPKKAQAAYMFFITQERKNLIQKYNLNPSKIAEVAGKAGEVWKGMSEAEKKPYQDMADKDKLRHEKESAAYVPDPSQFITKKGAKKEKAEKDPNAPKRATTAFFFYLQENRAKIIAEHKLGKSPTEVTTKAGELWKGMSDDQKKPYTDKNVADKSRYERELAAFKPA